MVPKGFNGGTTGELVVGPFDLYRRCEEPGSNNTTMVPPGDVSDCLVVATPLVMLVFYILIGCIGIMGNVFVFVVMVFGKVRNNQTDNRHNFTVWFIVNQSSVDLLCSVFLLATSTVTSEVSKSGSAGQVFCQLWQSKVWLWSMMTASTYSLLALTLERYLKLQHPMWYRKNFSKRWAVGLMVFAWCFGATLNMSYMIPTSVVVGTNCYVYSNWPSDTFRQAFAIFLFFMQFLCPLGCLLFGYARIAYTLHQRTKKNPQDSERTTTDPTWRTGRNNTIKTLIIVAICFVLCWSWNQVVYLLNFLDLQADFASAFYHFTVVAVYLNCALNPLIYAFKLRMFKEAARDLYNSIRRRIPRKISETRLKICLESQQDCRTPSNPDHVVASNYEPPNLSNFPPPNCYPTYLHVSHPNLDSSVTDASTLSPLKIHPVYLDPSNLDSPQLNRSSLEPFSNLFCDVERSNLDSSTASNISTLSIGTNLRTAPEFSSNIDNCESIPQHDAPKTFENAALVHTEDDKVKLDVQHIVLEFNQHLPCKKC